MKAKLNRIAHYDRQSDVLYFGRKGIEEEFVEVAPGINVEIDRRGQAIGVEILNASKILKSISNSKAIHQRKLAGVGV